MDLGRPVARHDIRRPHETDELDHVLIESVSDEQPVDEQPTRSETAEH